MLKISHSKIMPLWGDHLRLCLREIIGVPKGWMSGFNLNEKEIDTVGQNLAMVKIHMRFIPM